MIEYKYYLNARPAMPGAVPKDFVRIDENDKGGRYGAIYYNRELALKDVMDYELEIGEVVVEFDHVDSIILCKGKEICFYCAMLNGYTALTACEMLCQRYSSCDTVGAANDTLVEYERGGVK